MAEKKNKNVLEVFQEAIGGLVNMPVQAAESIILSDPLDKKKKKKNKQEIPVPGKPFSREVTSDKPLEEVVKLEGLKEEEKAEEPLMSIPRMSFPSKEIELPTKEVKPPQPTQLSPKAKAEAKEIPVEKSEGMSNIFMQGIGQMLPLLIGTALGGVEGGVAAGEGFVAARERERKAEQESKKLSQKDRELDLKESEIEVSQRNARLQAYSKLVDAKVKDQKDLRERFVGSKRYGNFTSIGDSKEAAKMRENLVNSETTAQSLDELLNLTEGVTVFDRDRIALAEGKINALVGKLKNSIVGTGPLSEQEREFVLDVIGDPTKLFGLEDVERLKLKELISKIDLDAKTMLQNQTVEGMAELKAYQGLLDKGYSKEFIDEKLREMRSKR